MFRVQKAVTAANLRWLKCQMCVSERSFSTKSSRSNRKGKSASSSLKTEIDASNHLDREINLLGPQDLRTPLPGDIGLGPFKGSMHSPTRSMPVRALQFSIPENLLQVIENNLKRQNQVTVHPITNLNVEENIGSVDFLNTVTEIEEENSEQSLISDNLECFTHSCPQLLINELQELFPNRNISQDLTVVTVSCKTTNDMSKWDSESEKERENLSEKFISFSMDVCSKLHSEGYWADFIVSHNFIKRSRLTVHTGFIN